MELIESQHLFGLGIGYVDAYLIAATLLTTHAGLWTRDGPLAGAAADLRIAYHPASP